MFSVQENRVDGEAIDKILITASDDDESAKLEMEIVWKESYFTKGGVQILEEDAKKYDG